jgi:hypothetical protein
LYGIQRVECGRVKRVWHRDCLAVRFWGDHAHRGRASDGIGEVVSAVRDRCPVPIWNPEGGSSCLISSFGFGWKLSCDVVDNAIEKLLSRVRVGRPGSGETHYLKQREVWSMPRSEKDRAVSTIALPTCLDVVVTGNTSPWTIWATVDSC